MTPNWYQMPQRCVIQRLGLILWYRKIFEKLGTAILHHNCSDPQMFQTPDVLAVTKLPQLQSNTIVSDLGDLFLVAFDRDGPRSYLKRKTVQLTTPNGRIFRVMQMQLDGRNACQASRTQGCEIWNSIAFRWWTTTRSLTSWFKLITSNFNQLCVTWHDREVRILTSDFPNSVLRKIFRSEINGFGVRAPSNKNKETKTKRRCTSNSRSNLLTFRFLTFCSTVCERRICTGGGRTAISFIKWELLNIWKKEAWGITERKKWPRDLPGFEPGTFCLPGECSSHWATNHGPWWMEFKSDWVNWHFRKDFWKIRSSSVTMQLKR